MKSSKKFYAFLLHVALSDESSFMELLIKWSKGIIDQMEFASNSLNSSCINQLGEKMLHISYLYDSFVINYAPKWDKIHYLIREQLPRYDSLSSSLVFLLC